jgi:SEL1 protein
MDEFAETVLLISLCFLILLLFYVRTRAVRTQQQGADGANEPQPQADANGGVFPLPGDPARDDWAILR